MVQNLPKNNPDLKPGSYVVLTIEDNGKGLDEEARLRIFEPFFTTKDSDKGTGLGLSVSFMIIENFGGKIEAISKPGEGTTMTVFLPLCMKDK